MLSLLSCWRLRLRLSARGILQSLQFLCELIVRRIHRSLRLRGNLRACKRLLRGWHLLVRGVAHRIRELLKLFASLLVSEPRLVPSRTVRPIRRLARVRGDRLLLLRGIRKLRILLLCHRFPIHRCRRIRQVGRVRGVWGVRRLRRCLLHGILRLLHRA